jgi:hypothetical protein
MLENAESWRFLKFWHNDGVFQNVWAQVMLKKLTMLENSAVSRNSPIQPRTSSPKSACSVIATEGLRLNDDSKKRMWTTGRQGCVIERHGKICRHGRGLRDLVDTKPQAHQRSKTYGPPHSSSKNAINIHRMWAFRSIK